MRFDVTFNQFQHRDGHISTFITNPVQESLKRLKKKLLNNILFNPSWKDPSEQLFFITLTVDDEHYDDVFKEHSAGATMRQFMTLNRNWFRRGAIRQKRPQYTFQYAWRLERGSNGTKRLHYHMIIKTDASLDVVRKRFMQTWMNCRWDCLDLEKSFQLMDNTNLASIYVCKYASAELKRDKRQEHDTIVGMDVTYDVQGTIESPAQTKNEQQSRVWCTGRGFVAMPKPFRLNYDPDTKIWSKVLKANWRMLRNEEIPNEWQVPIDYNGVPIGSDRSLEILYNICKENIVLVDNHLYENIDPVKPVRIRSIRGITGESALVNEIEKFTKNSEFPTMDEFEPVEILAMRVKLVEFAEKFGYETPPVRKFKTIRDSELQPYTFEEMTFSPRDYGWRWAHARIAAADREIESDRVKQQKYDNDRMFYSAAAGHEIVECDTLGGIFALERFYI